MNSNVRGTGAEDEAAVQKNSLAFSPININQIYYALVYTGNGWKEQTWECSFDSQIRT